MRQSTSKKMIIKSKRNVKFNSIWPIKIKSQTDKKLSNKINKRDERE